MGLTGRYILRLTKERFRQPQTQVQDAKEQLELVKRQSIVYKLFGRSIKNVLVSTA